jgi:hypothetical protein
VTDRDGVVRAVHEAFEAAADGPLGPPSDLELTPLGKGGLELDSIQIVEALLACEERLGTPIGALLEGDGPITFRAVVDHFASA